MDLVNIFVFALVSQDVTLLAAHGRIPSSKMVWGPPIQDMEKKAGKQMFGDVVESTGAMKKGLTLQQIGDYKGSTYRGEINSRWPNREIPYRIESTIGKNKRRMIAHAMLNIEESTCLTFLPATRSHTDWVDIYTSGAKGCQASHGYQGPGFRQHDLALDMSACFEPGIIVYELLLVAGQYPEHQRPDRDHHITVNWTNIQTGREKRFYKHSWDYSAKSSFTTGLRVPDFGIGYDFKSVMHLGLKSFAIDPKERTLTSLTGLPKDMYVGRSQLSEKDILKLNKAYSCNSIGGKWLLVGGDEMKISIPSEVKEADFVLQTLEYSAVKLKLSVEFALDGSCNTDYLEVRAGCPAAHLIGKFCRDVPIPDEIGTGVSSVWIKWKSSSKRSSPTLTGSWSIYRSKLINKIPSTKICLKNPYPPVPSTTPKSTATTPDATEPDATTIATAANTSPDAITSCNDTITSAATSTVENTSTPGGENGTCHLTQTFLTDLDTRLEFEEITALGAMEQIEEHVSIIINMIHSICEDKTFTISANLVVDF